MQIEMQAIPETTIDEFAETNDLVMQVIERDPQWWSRPDRFQPFYARFKNAETKDGCILRGKFGEGQTPSEAIADYARNISLKRLVIDATSELKRREIDVPRLRDRCAST